MKVIKQDTSTLDLSKKIYRCSICSNVFNWERGKSSWYGSMKAQEDGKPLVYYCSSECKEKHLPKKKKEDIEIKILESETESTLIYSYGKKQEGYRVVRSKLNGVKSLSITMVKCGCGKILLGDQQAININPMENFTLNCTCGETLLTI